MRARPIRNEEQYRAALDAVEQLMNKPEPTEEDLDHMEVMAILVEDYESKHYPGERPSPRDVLRFHMERLELNQKELCEKAGVHATHFSSYMTANREHLSVPEIQKLSMALDIDPGWLVELPAVAAVG